MRFELEMNMNSGYSAEQTAINHTWRNYNRATVSEEQVKRNQITAVPCKDFPEKNKAAFLIY